MSPPVENLVSCLQAKRSGKGWRAKCPAHEDHEPSLSISEGADGRALLKCFGGCSTENVLVALGLTPCDLFPDTQSSGRSSATPRSPRLKVKQPEAQPFDWRACVEAFTDKHVEQIAEWRGYSPDFVNELRDKGQIGIYNGLVAFPVHDRAGNVVAVHYRLKDRSWRYYPQGATVRPLVIGELVAGERVQCFESTWDGLDYLDKSGEREGVVITRGAGNAKLVEVVPSNCPLYVWTQNDEPGQEWERTTGANFKGTVKRCKIPAPHKDLNDWTRAGATVDDLFAAMVNAEVIREARNDKSEATEPPGTQAQPFPLHCLPPSCEAMARAVCETVRVLESLPGCCALGILSAAIGSGLQVRSAANRLTRGNLYILPSAESGSGKSETYRHLAKPLFEFEAKRVAAWDVESKPGLVADHKILEAEIANLTKSAGRAKDATDRDQIRGQLKAKLGARDQIERQLHSPILSCEDVTGEKLAVLLAHNREQLASLSADASAVVNILLGRYNKLDRTDEGIYLKSFTGDRCKVDRQTRASVLLESPCLAALWLTQPDKLESLLAERSLSDGGLIPRILACHTHCEAREIVKNAPEIPASVEKGYADLIRSLLESYRLADEPFTIEPKSEALEAMNAHYNAIVKRRRTDLRDVTIYAARWNEQAWRIAVVLHAGLHGAHAHEHKLETDTANRAIELADWFAAQQLEILSGSRDKARREEWNEVLSLADEKPQGIRASDVYRARIVRNADEAHTLLSEMEAAGELRGREEKPETGGHFTRIFIRAKK
jgi:hypothetical protein